MDSPKTPEELATHIETLVSGYVDEIRRHAQQAVERGISAATSSKGKPRKPTSKSKRAPSKRRSAAEISGLSEALSSLIHDRPGESMVTFAGELGVTVRELYRPMKMLKEAGQIRSVGQRHRTRYFPAINGKASRARG